MGRREPRRRLDDPRPRPARRPRARARHAAHPPLVDRLAARVEEASRGAAAAMRVRVVGAGAAGVELACTLDARIRRLGVRAEITVVTDEAEFLTGYPRRVAARMRRELDRRCVAVRERVRAIAVERDTLVLESARLPADLVVWATGAAPLPFLARSPLPHDDAGFVRVRPTLQVERHDELFAAGDCATLASAPWVPKAGVYAVRQGPVLDANLRALLAGRGLRRFRPQRDFLSLLNLGDRRRARREMGARRRRRLGVAPEGPHRPALRRALRRGRDARPARRGARRSHRARAAGSWRIRASVPSSRAARAAGARGGAAPARRRRRA
jgi:hypothetical protein